MRGLPRKADPVKMEDRPPCVEAVSRRASHNLSKLTCKTVTLVKGLGVEGDSHSGATVKHRSRVVRDPSQPNLRQVHLLHRELLDALIAQGFWIGPGILGENITTAGLDLLGLPRGTLLQIGPQALVEVTGLRNPCRQLDDYQPGLMRAVLERDARGKLIRKAGVMGRVVSGGLVAPGAAIAVTLPEGPQDPLEPV
ncbi:MAG: MOSC domain-containing protein [Rhodospirillales bacterium]